VIIPDREAFEDCSAVLSIGEGYAVVIREGPYQCLFGPIRTSDDDVLPQEADRTSILAGRYQYGVSVLRSADGILDGRLSLV